MKKFTHPQKNEHGNPKNGDLVQMIFLKSGDFQVNPLLVFGGLLRSTLDLRSLPSNDVCPLIDLPEAIFVDESGFDSFCRFHPCQNTTPSSKKHGPGKKIASLS